MRSIVISEGGRLQTFNAKDPSSYKECDFEADVIRALKASYPDYRCFVFGGSFIDDDGVSKRPDLALIAPDCSHWFIIEVEMLSHSLERHVLPQMRTIRYGDPMDDCSIILSRELGINRGQATNILKNIPRSVAVMANGHDNQWATALKAIEVQFLSVFSYANKSGGEAFALSGYLTTATRNIGFGTFDGSINSIRFPKQTTIPTGSLQFEEPDGIVSIWSVSAREEYIWVTKERGRSNMHNGAMVQIVQKSDGQMVLRNP